ncbi:MAG: hypothetical protein CM15mP49_09920 [Actinomycetota bacterium]|nr:MAG: hypothetical protein CM15mP49_09920 [Actinomycetota bacterium]
MSPESTLDDVLRDAGNANTFALVGQSDSQFSA